jgi:hypothetical protein
MKKFLTLIFAITLSLGFSSAVQASLVGDDVLVEHRFPDMNTPYEGDPGGGWKIVDAESPEATLAFGIYAVDIGESDVHIDFLDDDQFGTVAFHGLYLADLNDSNPENILLGVTVVDTSFTWWDDSRLLFGEDFVYFNWAGIGDPNQVASTDYFDAVFQFGPNPIPIPTSLVLFVTGFVGLMLIRRKFN